MSLTDGHKAVISRIVAGAGVTNVVLPNGPGKSLPRYVVQEAGGSQTTAAMSGLTDAVAEVVVLVETESGVYSTLSNTLVKALVSMFPVSISFGTSPVMTVIDAPDVRPPLPISSGVYSVPVVIRAHFSF